MTRTSSQTKGRFRALWNILRWEGELRNSRLRQLFGLQKVQVSRLLASFAEEYPRAAILDDATKSWRINDESLAVKEAGPLDEYLALCRHESEPLPIIDARVDFAEPRPKIVATLAQAASAGSGVEVVYRSMSTPAGRERLLFPTAVVRLSQRWHVRAWCADRREYRDFNIGRIDSARKSGRQLPSDYTADIAWNTIVSVRIGVHEALKGDVAKMLRQEYFNGATSMRLDVRGALIPYVLQESRVTATPSKERPPSFLLQVLNPNAIKEHLFQRTVD
jgi:hypothetical protein